MAYVPITAVDITPATGTGAQWYEDEDISAHVASGAVGAHIIIKNSSESAVGMRKPGSTESRTTVLRTGRETPFYHGVVSQTIDFHIDRATSVVWLQGYFDGADGESFQTTTSEVSPAATFTWEDADLSTITGGDTALIAFIEIIGDSTSKLVGMRKNGSTDARTRGIIQHGGGVGLVGLDGSEICELYNGSTVISMYVVGWMTGGVTWKTNGVDRSLGTTGSYQDISGDWGNNEAAIMESHTGGASVSYAFRKNGSTFDLFGVLEFHNWSVVPSDATGVIEMKISSTDVDTVENGHFAAAAVAGGLPAGGLSLLGVGV